MHEGDTDDHLYVVLTGSLGVVKAARTDNELTLNIMRPGDVVGELSFLDGATRFASLVAMAETRVLGLSRGDLEALLDRDPQLVYRIMRAIVRIAHDIQRRLSMHMVPSSPTTCTRRTGLQRPYPRRKDLGTSAVRGIRAGTPVGIRRHGRSVAVKSAPSGPSTLPKTALIGNSRCRRAGNRSGARGAGLQLGVPPGRQRPPTDCHDLPACRCCWIPGLVFLSDSHHTPAWTRSTRSAGRPSSSGRVIAAGADVGRQPRHHEGVLNLLAEDHEPAGRRPTCTTARTCSEGARCVGATLREMHHLTPKALRRRAWSSTPRSSSAARSRANAPACSTSTRPATSSRRRRTRLYFQIGETKYGKPIIDRVIRRSMPLSEAAKCALISIGFDHPLEPVGRLARSTS